MARSMPKTKKMLKEFWVEVLYCGVYLSNRCPLKGLDGMIPQEAWNGKKPSATHLKVFGSIRYVHIDDPMRIKLNVNSKKLIFMGYDQKSKWYNLYNPNKGKMVITRDVEFVEKREWDWEVDGGGKYDYLPILDEEKER